MTAADAESSFIPGVEHRRGKRSKVRHGDFTRFRHIARGSAAELEYQLLLARVLDLIPLSKFAGLTEQVSEVHGMLTALIQHVQPVRIKSVVRS